MIRVTQELVDELKKLIDQTPANELNDKSDELVARALAAIDEKVQDEVLELIDLNGDKMNKYPDHILIKIAGTDLWPESVLAASELQRRREIMLDQERDRLDAYFAEREAFEYAEKQSRNE